MSYILDALKKSDRDRDRHRQAPLAQITGTPEFRAGRRAGVGRVRLLGVSALVVGAAWGGFGLARLDPPETSGAPGRPLPSPVVASVAMQLPAAPSDAGNVQYQPAASTSQPPPEAAPPTPTATDSAESSGAQARTREGLLELWQLTDAEQKYLQGLDVSFHVHSNEPAQRAVIINGLRAGEGQALGEDLRLAEIVPDGIILEFQGQLVHLGNPQPY